LGGEFIPSLEEGDFAVDTRVLTGSNLNTTIEYTQKAAHILKSQYPEVEKVVTKMEVVKCLPTLCQWKPVI
jgi:cobalt-zinc-cadmium resistance protein CzcA